MLKSLSAALVIVYLIAGCVTVGPTPATISPSAGTPAASFAVTTSAPATALATGETTSAATPAATPSAFAATTPALTSLAPSSAPAPASAESTAAAASFGPTNNPAGTPGAPSSVAPATISDRDLLFSDDMTDASSGWDELNEDFATITYDTGVLAFRYDKNKAWAYTVRKLAGPETSLVVASEFMPQSDGIFGSLCGDSTTGKFYGAVVDTNGGLIFLETDNGTIKALDRQDKLGLDVQLNVKTPLAVKCIANSDGDVVLSAGLSMTGPVGVHLEKAAGPTSFDVVGLYAEALSDGYTLAVDDAAAFGVGGSDGTMSAGAQQLMTHIPAEMQRNCSESPLFSDTATYVVNCLLQPSGKGAELAQYEQYDTKDAMDAKYQDIVSTFGTTSTGTCQSGPNETDWSISGTTYGRVECVPQKVGIRFDWTDDRVNILSSLIDFDGDYASTFDQWVNAGPNE